MAHAQGQQHPIGIYLKIWGLLFVLSTASYLVDYFHFHGYLRWFLILTFMLLKAGLIVAVFMHMMWERLALMYAILVPPLLLMVLLGIGAFEAELHLPDARHVLRARSCDARGGASRSACGRERLAARAGAPDEGKGKRAIARPTTKRSPTSVVVEAEGARSWRYLLTNGGSSPSAARR